MFTSSSILLLCIATASAANPLPPFWGPFWSAPFDQSITVPGYQFNDTVGFLYDSTTKPVGSSLYQHGLGQHDEICTGVAGHEYINERCNLLASTDLWRYAIYPDTKQCCKVCDTADYCGIVAPDWLQKNSTYEGEKVINGLTCEGFMKEGGEQNFYYAEKTTQQPCLYYEGYPVLPDTSNYWRFITSNFSRAPIASSSFDVPVGFGCEFVCIKSPTTYIERVAKRAELKIGNPIART
jgi:hypothetical protein